MGTTASRVATHGNARPGFCGTSTLRGYMGTTASRAATHGNARPGFAGLLPSDYGDPLLHMPSVLDLLF